MIDSNNRSLTLNSPLKKSDRLTPKTTARLDQLDLVSSREVL